MQSDDDLPTTLSKWPFILCDVLLVATALAIAILGDWRLTNWQVGACVISVALGCGLFVLPYIVEYQVRVREESDDRSADLRIMRRHLIAAEAQLDASDARIESLSVAVQNLTLAQAEYTGEREAAAEKFASMQSEHAQQSTRMQALAQLLDSFKQELKLLTEQVTQFGDLQAQQATALDDLLKKVTTLQTSQQSPIEPVAIEKLQTELSELAVRVEAVAVSVEEQKADLAESESSATKKVRASRRRRNPEPRLLQRAIEQKQDASSEAVSRIIEAKSRPSPTKLDEDAPPQELQQTVLDGAVAAQSDPVVIPELSLSESNLTEATGERLEVEPTLFSESSVVEATPVHQRTKKTDTSVIASVFIGIGNKPYIRGSGAGLSWEVGIAMEFEEIGKWRWLTSVDFQEPIDIQIFRNDEDPDTCGQFSLQPGQVLELSPIF
ncbi:hypothetical protein QEH59_09350 [Coraliomargarita sp. SDUM461004]|uniref:Chromosome partition protein Smc n=1 Tax=Thalassobacterium sedimentorum TaxID=3041258 RepID=A0ABU1ALJ0_9BACT|nr:hypothetical protein [Coraliomargarita sp. SDUM461004]MDQ8194631.1 hypothetical protein [Coraliomargarita sp. SDUM461004]